MELPPLFARDMRQFLQYLNLERGLAETTRSAHSIFMPRDARRLLIAHFHCSAAFSRHLPMLVLAQRAAHGICHRSSTSTGIS